MLRIFVKRSRLANETPDSRRSGVFLFWFRSWSSLAGVVSRGGFVVGLTGERREAVLVSSTAQVSSDDLTYQSTRHLRLSPPARRIPVTYDWIRPLDATRSGAQHFR